MTDWVVIVLLGFFAVLVCVCAAALVEVFRQLAELRAAAEADDQPLPVELPSDAVTAEQLGLPERVARLPEAALVFLHQRCATCHAVAETFREEIPATVWLVVPESDLLADAFPALAHVGDRLIPDADDAIASTLGLKVAPAVVTVRGGVVDAAFGVSTTKQLLSLVPSPGEELAAA